MSAKEPNCRHAPKLRISSHEDLVEAARAGVPMASIYSCERERCKQEATFWVQGVSGKPAIVTPL